MKRIACAVLAPLLLLSACGSDQTKTPADAPAKPAATPAPAPAETAANPTAAPTESPKAPTEDPQMPNADLDTASTELMAKPEQPDEKIEIQHILISFQGAPRMRGVTRDRYEAKEVAQKVWGEVIAGGDFDALVKQYTNDSAPGIYPLTKAGRAGMVKCFGDIGFRLKVGEVGVTQWNTEGCPFGWHIIKRLK